MFIVNHVLRCGAAKIIILVAVCALHALPGVASAAINYAPKISGTAPTAATVGSRYSFTPGSSDANGDTLHFIILNRPSWLNFSYGTGSLYGTPTSPGTWENIQISVSDGKVRTSLPKFSITVKASTTNHAPTISGTPPASVTAGSPYSFRPSAADTDKNTLAFSIQNKPSWASFSTASGTLSGTPASSYVGTYANIVIAVSDGKATAKLPAFSIVVKSSSTTNSAPRISGTAATSVTAGHAYSFTPTASDANGDKLTFSITSKPSWASFSTSTGKLSGMPTAAQVGSYARIGIQVSDGKASTSLAAFTINVVAAGASTGSATLSWTPPTQNTDGSSLSNLSGYRIYYGTSSSALNHTIQVSGAGMNRYVIGDLAAGKYYFAVKALTSTGRESALSNIASKTIN